MFSLKLLLCCLTTSVLSHDCGVTPEWENELASVGKATRRLATSTAFLRNATLGPVRIVPYYLNMTVMTPAQLTRVQQVIIPGVLSWYSHLLSLYNLNQNWVIHQTTCGSQTIPLAHQTTGISGADYVIYINAVNDTAGSYLAMAGACAFDGGNSRGSPIAGSFQLNALHYNSYLTVENEISIVRHEMSHALGISASMFPMYTKPDGTLYANPVVSATMRGETVTLLATPAVTARARAAFNCSTVQGLELEQSGGTGTAGSHPAVRVLFNDYMSGHPMVEPIYSDVMIAAFEDSGWYTVNYTYTDQIKYGKGKGCSFLNTTCISNGVAQFSEFCTATTTSLCDIYNSAKSYCFIGNYTTAIPTQYQYFSNPLTGGLDTLNEYCPYAWPFSNGDCKQRSDQATYINPTYYGEQVGASSMCFTGTYIKTGITGFGDPNHAGCHSVTCANGVATVTIGATTIQCPPAGGLVSSITGYTGFINCPSYGQLCGIQVCPNGCFGYGICMSGTCACSDGHSGIDCSIICDPTCKTCSGTGSNQCLTCYTTASVNSGTCVCHAGVPLAPSSKCIQSIGCDSSCATCIGPTASQCASCPTGYALDPALHICFLICDGLCAVCNVQTAQCSTCDPNTTKSAIGTCLCNAGFVRSAAGTQCLACDPTCATCSGLGSLYCTGCQANASLPTGLTIGQCSCNTGFYLLPNYTCGACSVTCNTCSGTAQNCTSCKATTAIVSAGACVCPGGFFLSINGSVCSACSALCLTCSGASSSQCTVCKPNAIFPVGQTTGVCSCISSYYVTTSGTCAACNITCKTCGYGPQWCTSCKAPTATANYSPCVCPSGTILSSDGTQCTPCYSSCRTCSGPLNTQCTSCSTGTLRAGVCSARVLGRSDYGEVAESESNCGSTDAPLAIVSAIVFLGLTVTWLVAFLDHSKIYAQSGIEENTSLVATESKSFIESLMGTHFFIGLITQTSHLTRWMKGLLMTTSLLTEMFVIGVLYASNTSDINNSAPLASASSEYGWTDFSYVLAALAVGLGLSSILLTLICSGSRIGKRLGSALVRLGVVIAIGISALAVAGIVYLNYHLCAAAGGLWAFSFLHMFLGEVLVCQTVLSAGRNLVSYLL